MANFSMTCTCGHEMIVDAPNREAAVSMMQAGMTQEALDAHMKEFHKPGEQAPTLEQSRAMIAQVLVAA